MDQTRNIQLASVSDALSAWVFWVEALDRPDADKLVKGRNQASIALGQIYQKDFQMGQMASWLREWPTPSGLDQYLRLSR